MGDMNYRCDLANTERFRCQAPLPKADADAIFAKLVAGLSDPAIRPQALQTLHEADQLGKMMRDRKVLVGFEELPGHVCNVHFLAIFKVADSRHLFKSSTFSVRRSGLNNGRRVPAAGNDEFQVWLLTLDLQTLLPTNLTL
jgi:hypothetical protein